MKPKSQEEVALLVRAEVAAIEPAQLRDAVLQTLIDPSCERRAYAIGGGATSNGDLWIFARLPCDDIGLAYSDEGYGEMGISWGLVSFSDSEYGSSGNWYRSLLEMVEDSGYF